jgi:hypothetical protein
MNTARNGRRPPAGVRRAEPPAPLLAMGHGCDCAPTLALGQPGDVRAPRRCVDLQGDPPWQFAVTGQRSAWFRFGKRRFVTKEDVSPRRARRRPGAAARAVHSATRWRTACSTATTPRSIRARGLCYETDRLICGRLIRPTGRVSPAGSPDVPWTLPRTASTGGRQVGTTESTKRPGPRSTGRSVRSELREDLSGRRGTPVSNSSRRFVSTAGGSDATT